MRRGWLRRAVDLDDVAVGIEEVELGETGRAVAADKNTQRVILRRVFAKTAGSQRGEGAVEIVSAESKMAIGLRRLLEFSPSTVLEAWLWKSVAWMGTDCSNV